MSTSRLVGHTDDHEGHRHRRRRRHEHAFPPSEYTNFTRTDLSLIAPILLPKHPHVPRYAYEKRTKRLISELPEHLQCKHSLLSSFCSVHGKLSPGPIISLFNAMRQEIEDEVPRVWIPLAEKKQLSGQKEEMVEIVQHLAVLWLGPKAFRARFRREPRLIFTRDKPSKCAACTLVRMGSDFQTQIAMAGLFIGRVQQGVWDTSKRIQWFLEWTSARVPNRKDDAQRLIWEIGKKFRMTRLGAEESTRKRKRTKVEPAQEEESELGPGTAIYAVSLDQELREEKRRGPRKMIDSKPQRNIEQNALVKRRRESEMDDVDEWEEYDDRSRPQASSIYSCTTSGEGPPSISISRDIDEVLRIYQQTMVGGEVEEGDHEGYPILSPYGGADDEFGLNPSQIRNMFKLGG